MQAIHCTSDAPYVLARLGAARAAEGAYVWQKLMKSGAMIPNGTDAPVEAVDPMPGYHALVARRQKNGEVFYGDQVMSREEALRAYTLNGAYAAFEEKTKGSLTPGKYADVTVLSADITKVPEAEIEKTQVVYTVVGGKIEFERRASDPGSHAGDGKATTKATRTRSHRDFLLRDFLFFVVEASERRQARQSGVAARMGVSPVRRSSGGGSPS